MASRHATMRQPDMSDRVSVLLPLPLTGAYDYRVPPELDVVAGDYVIVPLGARHVNGVVWGPPGRDVGEEKLKDIIGLLDLPPMTEALRRFVDWVAAYTLSPPGAVLRMTMSVPSALDAPRTVTAYLPVPEADRPGPDSRIRMTAARERVLSSLSATQPPDQPKSAAVLART